MTKSHAPWPLAIAGYLAMVVYFSLTSGVWFWCMGLCRFVRSREGREGTARLINSSFFFLISAVYYYFIENYSLFIFGRAEGYPFLNPLILVAEYRPVLWVVAKVGAVVRWITFGSALVLNPLAPGDVDFVYVAPVYPSKLEERSRVACPHDNAVAVGQRVYHKLAGMTFPTSPCSEQGEPFFKFVSDAQSEQYPAFVILGLTEDPSLSFIFPTDLQSGLQTEQYFAIVIPGLTRDPSYQYIFPFDVQSEQCSYFNIFRCSPHWGKEVGLPPPPCMLRAQGELRPLDPLERYDGHPASIGPLRLGRPRLRAGHIRWPGPDSASPSLNASMNRLIDSGARGAQKEFTGVTVCYMTLLRFRLMAHSYEGQALAISLRIKLRRDKQVCLRRYQRHTFCDMTLATSESSSSACVREGVVSWADFAFLGNRRPIGRVSDIGCALKVLSGLSKGGQPFEAREVDRRVGASPPSCPCTECRENLVKEYCAIDKMDPGSEAQASHKATPGTAGMTMAAYCAKCTQGVARGTCPSKPPGRSRNALHYKINKPYLKNKPLIIITPETFYPYSLNRHPEQIALWSSVIPDHAYMIVGSQIELGPKFYQAAYLLHNCLINKYYVKHHCAPFVEKIPKFYKRVAPLRQMFLQQADEFSRGRQNLADGVFEVGDNICLIPQICSEFFFKTTSRQVWDICRAQPEKKQGIIFLVNDSWFVGYFQRMLKALTALKAAYLGLPVIYVGHKECCWR